MKYYIPILLACLLFISCQKKTSVRLHILGDSTTEQQNQNVKNMRGWPQLLHHFFTEEVTVLNHGKSGASSRTFYEEKYWENARKTIHPGDYVVIQFGHNDEKHQGIDGMIGTVANVSYREYLQKFVDEIRTLGAYPIFATPIVRKIGKNDKCVSRRSSHDLAEYVASHVNTDVNPDDTVSFNYPHNMREVAKANGCPLVDMTISTAALNERLGYEVATQRIYDDGTHLRAGGALLFSKLFVDELKAKGILADYIIDDPGMIIEPNAIDFGKIVQKATYTQEIDLLKLVEDSDFCGFQIKAGEGVLISDRQDGAYKSELYLPAAFDAAYYQQLYVRVNLAKEGVIQTEITVDDGKENYIIPVKAEARPYDQGEPVLVEYPLRGNKRAETVEGQIVAIEHTINGLEIDNFDILGLDGIGAHLDPPITFRAEWLTIPGGKWPKDEIDVIFNRYAQFGVQAAPNTVLQLEQIILFVGGGVNYRIQISKDPSFANYEVVGEGSERLLTKYIIPIRQEIKKDETLFLRVYPWSSSERDALLCLSHVSFKGIAKAQ